MAITSESAKDIARLGGNLVITENAGYTSQSVKDIIRLAAPKGHHVTVHAASYTSESLKDMVRIGGANVTIVI